MLASSATATAQPPRVGNQRLSWKPTFWTGSSSRDGTSSGRSPASNERSATRAARLAERTDANVATPSTSVPPAVASDEIVTQSATAAVYGLRARRIALVRLQVGATARVGMSKRDLLVQLDAQAGRGGHQHVAVLPANRGAQQLGVKPAPVPDPLE